MSLKVISYNLLHPDYAKTHPATCLSDGGKTWATRRTQAEANISGADIVCLQECDKSMVESIKAPKQAFFAAHKGKPDGVGILVDSTRFTVLDIKTEYDIPTGHATLFVDLFDKTTQKTIRVASMHLKGGPIRTDGDNQLQGALKRIESESSKKPIDATIIAGDFNQDQVSGPTSRLRFVRDYTLGSPVLETEIGKGRQIDWIGVKTKGPLTLGYVDPRPTPRASDHHPLVALIDLRAGVSSPIAPAPMTMAKAIPTAAPSPKNTEESWSICDLIMRVFGMKQKEE
jgi:endonuclease/exonuclease/phosphatase family metal-dependent hydrolase